MDSFICFIAAFRSALIQFCVNFRILITKTHLDLVTKKTTRTIHWLFINCFHWVNKIFHAFAFIRDFTMLISHTRCTRKYFSLWFDYSLTNCKNLLIMLMFSWMNRSLRVAKRSRRKRLSNDRICKIPEGWHFTTYKTHSNASQNSELNGILSTILYTFTYITIDNV